MLEVMVLISKCAVFMIIFLLLLCNIMMIDCYCMSFYACLVDLINVIKLSYLCHYC